MSNVLTGGCQCGAVRYQITAAPKWLYACHCTDCQKQSSSAFGMSLAVSRESLNARGDLRHWTKTADSGRKTVCFFCPMCGTRIYHAPERDPSIVNVKAGTLDDTADLWPSAHLWVQSRQRWLVLPEGAECFETQPANISAAMAGQA
jgi:hypothetical protein